MSRFTDFRVLAPVNTPTTLLPPVARGYVATQANVDFVFVRNISDTLVPAKPPANPTIPPDAQQTVSSAVYDAYGMFTSLNSAIAAGP